MTALLVFALLFAIAPAAAPQRPEPQTGHTSDVTAVRFGPDDRTLVSYSAGDRKLILWDTRAGTLVWMAPTEFLQRGDEHYNLETFAWSADGSRLVTRFDNGRFAVWDARTGGVESVADAAPALALAADAPRPVSVWPDSGTFHLHDAKSGKDTDVESFSRTSDVFDVSHDGALFAEGGSYGNAGIKITEIATGRSRVLYGREASKRLPPHRPGALETRLALEGDARRAEIEAARLARAKRAAAERVELARGVTVAFDHFGDMDDPGEARMVESGDPGRSAAAPVPRERATAAWVRMRNRSSLPVEIPTQSMYLPSKDCFYESPTGARLSGLCDGREVGLWFGLVDRKGKPVPYGSDFGSSAILLPGNSVLFAIPLDVLEGGRAVRFAYAFQKDEPNGEFTDYGEPVEVTFGESDIAKGRAK